MNERIKELEKQCLTHRVDGALVDGQLHFDTQKFAELIVRECCEVAHCNFHVDGLTLGGIMKKHFGVEE